MKIRIFTFLISLFFMLGTGNNVFGQAVGDLVFTNGSGDGRWHTASNWSKSDGAGGYQSWTPVLPTTSDNVWIPNGQTVLPQSGNNLAGTYKFLAKDLHVLGILTCKNSSTDYGTENSQFLGNIYIESTGIVNDAQKWLCGNSSTTGANISITTGGKFYFYAGSRWFFGGANGSNFTVTNEGTIGASSLAANVGPTVTIGGTYNGNVNVTFTGGGTTILKSIVSDNYAPACNITIDQNVILTANSGAAIKLSHSSNVTNLTSRSFTINSGYTVTLYYSGCWFANTASNSTIDSNNTFYINGTLDASLASTYFGCTSNTAVGNSGTTNSQIINIGSTGTLKCGSVVSVNKPQAGQTLAINVVDGGTITYAGTAYQTLPTTSTYAVTASPYALLTNSNSNLSFTNASSAVTMNTDLNVSGNLVLSASGTWSGTGKTIMTGSGKTISAGTLGNLEIATGAVGNIITTSGALTVNGDATVTTGTLKLGANLTTYNVSVASGAVLTANIGSNSGSRRTLTVGAGAADNDAVVTVNGTLGGTKWSTDGIDIEVSANAKTFTLSGTGTIAISGIRPAANANSRALDIYLNRSLYLSRDNGGAANIEPALTLQNGTCTFNRTLTVSNGVTLTFQGNAGLHGKRNDPNSSDELLYNYASSSSNQGNCTYNINGIMDLRSYSTGAICNLNTTSFAGNTQSVTLNVGSTGVLKLGRVIKMYTALSGQTVSIVPATGSTVEYGGTTAATILLTTGTGTAPTLPAAYTNLTISNTNGITLPTDFSVSGTMAIDESLTGGTITLLPLANATVASGKTLTASILNLNSNSSGTATLLNNGTATITTANVQQYLPDARNWYVSSPVSNALAPSGYTYYRYNEGASSWTSSSVVVGDQLIKGVGYIALPGSTGSTLTFTTQAGGTLNAGDVDVTLTRSGATKTGFNLIGNPYPCHLGWTYDFVNANSSLIESSIWIRTNGGTVNNSGQWSFATFNATSAESVPSVVNNGIIAPMQAFWVRAKAAGALTLNSNLTKSHQSSNLLKVRAATNDHRQRIRLQVSNGSATDESLIFFDAAASNGYDEYDSPKMTNNNVDIPEIYTVLNGQKLVMNGMNGIINDMEIPIGFTTGKSNTFSLKTTQLSNLDADVKVFLKDNSNSNLQTELNLNQEYTFTSDVTDNADRFSLIFKAPSLTTGDNFMNNNSVHVFSNGNNRILVENNLNIENATMMVYNAVGQLVETKILTGLSTISNLTYGSGVYFVTISMGDKTETTKLVINNI